MSSGIYVQMAYLCVAYLCVAYLCVAYLCVAYLCVAYLCVETSAAWRPLLRGLPLRGETEHDIETGDGLFLRAFSQLMFVVDPKLQIHKRLPNNAKYTSSDIQNEIISILAKLVKNNVADVFASQNYS